MNLEERIKSFSVLGEILLDALSGKDDIVSCCSEGSRPFTATTFNNLIDNQQLLNPWFTPENVRFAVNAIATELTEGNLKKWTDSYLQLRVSSDPLNIGVIMAGNIPLVGFHDFLSVLISGNNFIGKTSSKDSELIIYLSDILFEINPEFRNRIRFTENTLAGFDAVIATGSNNSSRYFEYYFAKYPNIIRKNRNSIAIIEGDESSAELEELGSDIFSYFGLGCRNVSKIFLPLGYDPASLQNNWQSYGKCINHSKYANNYDFNKAVYLVNRERFHDTGYLLMKEDTRLSSPVSVLFYEFYSSPEDLCFITKQLNEHIQCTVGRHNIPFGRAQRPQLWDYADGIDTIEFLLKKNIAGIL